MHLIAKVARLVIGVLEKNTDEEVLCVPRKAIEQEVDLTALGLIRPNWKKLVKLVNESGRYVRRSQAEKSDALMQIVPVCVIQFGDKYLTNVRHEPGESLHNAFGNWAGGHVRKQDLDRAETKWESVSVGMLREIHEELSLEDIPTPTPIGIVHTSEDARAARHLGVVFQSKFEDSFTAEALQNRTIRERPNRYVRTS